MDTDILYNCQKSMDFTDKIFVDANSAGKLQKTDPANNRFDNLNKNQ